MLYPNIIRGGKAIPIGYNTFLMKGRKHSKGGIDIGKDLEVEGGEVVQNGRFGTRVFSAVPFLRGISPSQLVQLGYNPDIVFNVQEKFKDINHINDDGSKKAELGINLFRPIFPKPISPSLNFANYLYNGGLNKLAKGFTNTMIGASVADSPTATGIAGWDNVNGNWQQPTAEDNARKIANDAALRDALANMNPNAKKELNLAQPINDNQFVTTSTSFGDIKSPRGFNEKDAEYIYDYLNKHSNFTDTAKAAILATIAFESGMKHNIKNPYSTAKGYFQWLNDRYVPTAGANDEQEKVRQLNKIIDDMTPVKGNAKGWTQTKNRNIFDISNEFRTTGDVGRAIELMTRHHIRPSLGEEPRRNKKGIEVDKGYKWEIAERTKVAKQFLDRINNRNKKRFGGEDKVYVPPKWQQEQLQKYGKITYSGYPMGIGLGIARAGNFMSLMRNNNIRNITRLSKHLGAKASMYVGNKILNVADRLISKFPEKYYDKLVKGRDILYNAFVGNGSIQPINSGGKISLGTDISRLPATVDAGFDFFNIDNQKQYGSMKQFKNRYKAGGLSRSKDYGSKDKPYPSVNKNDFAGGGRSYPIPTRADAVDALRLAGLHHRSDVRAKVYAKYPDLRKKAAMGTIDKDVLKALAQQNNNQQVVVEEPIRITEPDNYVEVRNTDADNLAKSIGTIVGGGAGLYGAGVLGNKLYNDFLSEDAIQSRRVSKILENAAARERAYRDRPSVLGKRFGKELSKVKPSSPDAGKYYNAQHNIDYQEPVKNNIKTADITKRDDRIAAGVKAAKEKIKTDKANIARTIKNSSKKLKVASNTMSKLFPALAIPSVIGDLFPSKERQLEADRAWRRYKSPTGKIDEDYQLKYGGRKKALYGNGDVVITANRIPRNPLEFLPIYTNLTDSVPGIEIPLSYRLGKEATAVPISDAELNELYSTIAGGRQNFPKDFNRLSLADVKNTGLLAKVPGLGYNLRGMNDFALNAYFGKLPSFNPADIRKAQTLTSVANNSTSPINVRSSYVFDNVPGYTGNVNGQQVFINPEYVDRVSEGFARNTFLRNTPEVVRGTTRRADSESNVNTSSSTASNRYVPAAKNLLNYNRNFLNGSDYNRIMADVNRFRDMDLSQYFAGNRNNVSTRNNSGVNQTVSPAAQRILDNAENAYGEYLNHIISNTKRPTLAQTAGKGFDNVNINAYTNPFAKTTSADVEAVRSGNFKPKGATTRGNYYLPTTTANDWISLGANALGSIGNYLITRNALKHYPKLSKPVPAVAQKLKTNYNINPQLDAIRNQMIDTYNTIDRNVASSRTAQARKQGVSNSATANRNQLYANKENIETQLINQDIQNRNQFSLYNNQLYNRYLDNIYSRNAMLANARINNASNLFNTLNAGLQDMIGRIDDRKAYNRNLQYLYAANPNVNWELIFNGNPKLAESLGLKYYE